MTNTNDQKILALTEQIRKKKEELGKIKKFSPNTNCSLTLEGTSWNLHALNKEDLILLRVKLYSLFLSAKELGLIEECIISGYNISNWLEDLENKYQLLSQKEKETKLKEMEVKLQKLLSLEKKTEIEINEIQALLGD